MTKRVDAARHRAATTGSFETLTKAVASNAGVVSRQAAVVAAAGGLVVTLGVSGSTAASKAKADTAPKADAQTTALDLKHIQRVASTEILANPAEGSKVPTASLVKIQAKPSTEDRNVARATVTPERTAAPQRSNDAAARTLPKLERTAQTSPATRTVSSQSDDSSSDEAPAPSVNGGSIVSIAQSYTGSPYRHGGVTPAGWDCIGFVKYVFAKKGVSMGGVPSSVLSVGKKVPYSQVQAGDILYWPGHVAISLGGDKNVGAWNPGMGTRVGPNSWVGGTPTVIRVG